LLGPAGEKAEMAYVNYEKEGRLAFIMLDRSDMNPINFEIVGELHDIWENYRDDDSLWVAILGSTGKNFSVGFDIEAIKQLLDDDAYSWKISSIFGEKHCGPDGRSITKPIIGIFNGSVNGGGIWLFLQCDIRITTKETYFGLGEGRLNFPVEFAGLLRRYMPMALIKEMLFTGKRFSADRFYELGIINRLVERKQLMDVAVKMAEVICESGPASIRVMKELVEYGYEMDCQSLMSFSEKKIVPVVKSEDTKEAVNCFLEKRRYSFK
jgi:enoyl-CoA hydratase/carnithine racemase